MRYQKALARTTLERLAKRRLSAVAADVSTRPRAAETPVAVDGA
jgi:hypothetical protein